MIKYDFLDTDCTNFSNPGVNDSANYIGRCAPSRITPILAAEFFTGEAERRRDARHKSLFAFRAVFLNTETQRLETQRFWLPRILQISGIILSRCTARNGS